MDRRPYSVVRIPLAMLSGALLVLAFPSFDLEFLAWIALVPLFFALDGLRPRQAFFIAWLAGAVFFLGALYWLIHVTLPGMIAVALYLALYVGAFGLAFSRFFRNPEYGIRTTDDGIRPADAYVSLFMIPASWVALEWLRSHLFTGFGWALLGHSQSYTPVVIQVADTTGAYGVSFLVALVNTAVFITAKEWRAKRHDISVIAIALFLVFLSLSYGIIRMKNVFAGEKINVAVVQGAISQERKWDSAFREEILRTYERLTEAAAAEKPDLIVWPETSVPGFLESEPDLLGRVSALARSAGTPLLVGTVREGPRGEYYNSASLISPDGKVARTYDKVHLVPFGEYIPFKKALSFVEKFAPVPIGDCTAGREETVFDFFVRKGAEGPEANWRLLKKVRFSCLVCFEDIFPGLARDFVKKGAGFLVVITNDAWYKRSSAPFQHAQNSIFRAVENRVAVVRAANTGVSCFIDQKGRVSGVVSDDAAGGFSVRGIVLSRARTWYTMYGDVFAYGCVVLVLCGLVDLKKFKRRP